MSGSVKASLSACMRVAASQYGVITRPQVLAAGLSTTGLQRLLADRTLTRMRPGVYALWTPSAEQDRWRQRLSAATLWLGPASAVSHRASMLHWELDGIDVSPLELSTESSRRSDEPGLVIHRVFSLPADDVVHHRDLWTTSAARTLVDAAGVIAPSALELAYESARRRGLVTAERLEDVMERLGARRRGRSALRMLLEDLPAEATASALETAVWQLFRKHGLPKPVRQFEIRDARRRLVARADFAYPNARLLIEADGRRFHSLDPDWNRDRRRQNALIGLGWTVYRLTWLDVRRRPAEVATQVAALYADGLKRTGAR